MVYIMGIGIGVNQIVGVDLGGLVSAADVILENMFTASLFVAVLVYGLPGG